MTEPRTRTVLLVAAGAALLGVAASLLVGGPGPLWRSRVGQQVLQQALLRPDAQPGLPQARRGEPLPALTLSRLHDRQPVTLPDTLLGRPALINAWASWCGPCIDEMPELQRFADSQGAGGVQVIGIALDDADAVHAFLARVPVRYPILLDASGSPTVSTALGNPKGVLPYSVLLDARGNVVAQRVGPFAHGELDDWVLTD